MKSEYTQLVDDFRTAMALDAIGISEQMMKTQAKLEQHGQGRFLAIERTAMYHKRKKAALNVEAQQQGS